MPNSQTASQTFTIRDLADEFAITTRTIRFYEDKKLLSPTREGQKRLFSKRDRATLKLILRGKRLGFSLDEITQLVSLYETPEDEAKQLTQYLKTLHHHKAGLKAQLQDIQQTLKELDNAEQDAANALRRLTS